MIKAPKKMPLFKNNNPLKKLKNRMALYSPIKIKEKLPPPYSVLKPDTNSDSPSLKSKGERLVSAKQATTQTITNGKVQSIENLPDKKPNFSKSYLLHKKHSIRKLKINTTS